MSTGRTVGRLAVEMVLIAAAVVLGFAVTEWGESRRDRRAGEEAVAAIARELTSNLEAVTRVGPYYGRISGMLRTVLQEDGDVPLASVDLEEWRGLSPPVLRSASFDLAVSTGALEHVDYALADRVSQAYEVQSSLEIAIEQALAAMVSGDLETVSDWLRTIELVGELTALSGVVLSETVRALDTTGDL